MNVAYTFLESPVGRVLVAWSSRGLERIGIGSDVDRQATASWCFDPDLDCDATTQLREYFAGTRRRFELPLVMEGTAFRAAVWSELHRIPFGDTLSYGDLATRIGNPRASRAVGLACGANPIPIVVPCHRVIGASGRLVGFGGGLAMKQDLLSFERTQIQFERPRGPLGL